jgi:replication factor C small subunit|tara:strand:- start:265 stop:897 length:633 start_codon:yes stop_codon:yes gene_type:complete
MESPFTEKFRPEKLSDWCLPDRIQSKLEKLIKKKDTGHLIFQGEAGNGKTATAKAIVKLLAPTNNIQINGSKDNSVDFIKDMSVKGMGASLFGEEGKRIIFIDEADGLTEKAQMLLRVPMEEQSHLCNIIMCFNDASKVIKPIKSRCLVFDFNPNPLFDEEKEIKKKLLKRFTNICKKEKIKLSKDQLSEIIDSNWYDVRKMVKMIELEA